MPYSIFFTNERKKVCSDLVKLIKDKKSKGQSIRSIADCLNVSYEPLLTACSALWFGEVSRTMVLGLWLLFMEILTHQIKGTKCLLINSMQLKIEFLVHKIILLMYRKPYFDASIFPWTIAIRPAPLYVINST